MASTVLSTIEKKPSEIDLLADRVSRLTRAVDFWNAWMVVGLVGAALAAVLIVLATRLAVVRAKELSIAQGELDSAKDRKLQADLKEKDHEIATLQTFASEAKTAQQQVEIDLEKQKEKTADAEKQLLEVAKRQAPRFVQKDALSSLLKGKATGIVTILYQPNDPEAYWFAFSLMGEITSGGWTVPSLPEPIPTNIMPRTPGFSDEDMQRILQFQQRFPDAMRVGVGSGLTILASSIQDDQSADDPYKVLTDALASLRLLNGRRMDISLPANNFVLVVGPKP